GAKRRRPGSEPVALELVPERALADAEQPGCPRLVVVGGAQGAQDELALELLDGRLERERLPGWLGGRGGSLRQEQAEEARLDLRPGGEDGGGLQQGVELGRGPR